MRKPILLFDLGNTLIEYFRAGRFTPVLRESIRRAGRTLRAAGHPVPSDAEVEQRVAAEDYTARNYRVRPLRGRLARIFRLRGDQDGELMRAMSSAFMGPIFATARRYEDTLGTLCSLRGRGYRIGILSNAPWGTPPWAWHEELERHGLAERCDLALFCGEVGWRKPALPLFRAALNHFACRAEECLFIGDDPRWDVYGARARRHHTAADRPHRRRRTWPAARVARARRPGTDPGPVDRGPRTRNRQRTAHRRSARGHRPGMHARRARLIRWRRWRPGTAWRNGSCARG